MSRGRAARKSKTEQPSSAAASGYLQIGDVARLVGVSPSVLRSWEHLGLLHPQRTRSRYRLYAPADLKVLKRARFLRRVRGLNPAAIVQTLKQQGLVRRRDSAAPAAIGPRLRSLRRNRRLSLAQVASATDISVAYLSALERSQMSAAVGTLRKLARFYGVNILDFFNAERSNPHLVRPAERKLLEAGRGVRMELLAWGDTVMEPHLFRIAPGASSGDSYTHEGEEFLYLVRGQLEISLEDQPFRLAAGDSFYFESHTPHRWVNPGKGETLVLWINTPPTF